MNIELYLYTTFNKSALDILKLLEDNDIRFSIQAFDEDDSLDFISDRVGEKVRRLPLVMIDGKRVGRYYDLMEFLVNKGVINYKGKP
jgi:glutaredoxin